MEYQNDFPTMGFTPHEIQHAIWELPHGKPFGKDYTYHKELWLLSNSFVETNVELVSHSLHTTQVYMMNTFQNFDNNRVWVFEGNFDFDLDHYSIQEPP